MKSLVPVAVMVLTVAAMTAAQRPATSPQSGSPAGSRTQQKPRLFPPEDLGLLEAPDRDEWNKPDLIMDALGIADGAVVADLGAGGGWFTIRLARRVGPNGLVYAQDIQPQSVRIGDETFSIRGFGPLSELAGLAANFADLIRTADWEDENKDVYDVWLASALAVGQQVLTAQFMRGASDLVTALSDPERGKAMAQNVAGVLIPGAVAYGWQGMSVQAAVPAPVVAKLHDALVAGVNGAEVQERFRTLGIESAPWSAREFQKFVQRENAEWRPLIRELGIRLDG